jgi:SSS family solute:Na+ symporter
VFLLGLLTHRTTGKGARRGFIAGLLTNAGLWVWVPEVSWLWWNVIGLAVTLAVGLITSRPVITSDASSALVWRKRLYQEMGFSRNWVPAYWLLGLWTCALFGVLALFGFR